MQPERALENWRNWQTKPPCKPEVVGPIGGGLSNQSFLINTAGEPMVLRINAIGDGLPGIDHQREATIWQAASRVDIAPRLMHAEEQFLVSEFIETDDQSLRTKPSSAYLTQALALLEKCHSLKVDVASLDYASHIQRYWDLIEASAEEVDDLLVLQREPMLVTLEILLASQVDLVVCHHDPVRANFVGSEQQLFLIDWEYAAKGMAVMDYAALVVDWNLADHLVIERTSVKPETLNHAKYLYRYLCQLWAAAQSSDKGVDTRS